jgi:glucosamine--fructose-6-phosphate aminotransferase (isomerizing)
MAEQPDVLRRLVARRSDLHAQIAEIVPVPLRGVAFTGRGSSANAAMIGRVLAELATGCPALLAAPSLDRLYDAHTDYCDYLGVGLSLSGRTPEVVSTLADLRLAGASTLAVTGDTSAPLCRAAQMTIDVASGLERAVPTTKGFTAQVAALVILSEVLGHRLLPELGWQLLPEATQRVLNDWDTVATAADTLATATDVTVVAAGMFLGVAHEVALKLQETALVAASAHSAASYRHGPIALAGARHPLIAVVGPRRAGAETLRLAGDVAARGETVLVIGAESDLSISRDLPEPLATIPAVVRGQQLALAIATKRGLDPDTPPGLSKVTVT